MAPSPAVEAEEAADRAAALRLRALIHTSRDIFLALSPELTINWVSPTIETVLGYEPSDLIGAPVVALVTAGSMPLFAEFLANRKDTMERETLELEVHTESRRNRLVEATLSEVTDTEAAAATGDAYVMTWRDVTDQRQLEQSLRKQSLYDPLTGLANRTTLHFDLQQRLQRLSRSEFLGLLHLDIDDFRAVNESIGFERGDELLVQVTTRLRSHLRADDLLARMGGNEFAIATVHPDPKAIVEMARRIAALFDEPFDVGDRQLPLTIAMGLNLTGDRRAGARDLLDQAALALGAARGNAQEPIQVYEAMMRVTATERFELGTDLVGAVGRNELHLVYQPIVDLASQAPHGVEALVRWLHPLRGPIPPNVFIPLAEKGGVIVELGRWVMAEACRQLVTWRQDRPEAMRLEVSVNVSARQLELAGEAERLVAIVTASGLHPSSVIVELTESTFFEDPEWIHEQLQTFRQAGMGVAVDDFGTGAAGISHLRDVPFDTIKIDKSYVDNLRTSDEAQLLVQGVIELAHTLGAKTVAEGIEDAPELAILADLGCDMVQGYYLGRPMDPAQLADWLAAHPGPARQSSEPSPAAQL